MQRCIASYSMPKPTPSERRCKPFDILMKAQQATEEMYSSASDPEIRMLEPKKPEDKPDPGK